MHPNAAVKRLRCIGSRSVPLCLKVNQCSSTRKIFDRLKICTQKFLRTRNRRVCACYLRAREKFGLQRIKFQPMHFCFARFFRKRLAIARFNPMQIAARSSKRKAPAPSSPDPMHLANLRCIGQSCIKHLKSEPTFSRIFGHNGPPPNPECSGNNLPERRQHTVTVFVVQRPQGKRRADGTLWTPDLSSAEKYGPLRFIFPGAEQTHLNPKEALETARRVLTSFQAEKDYICWASNSDPASLFATMLALSEIEPETASFLIWDRTQGDRSKGCYVPTTFVLRSY